MGFCDNITINTGVHGCDVVPGKPVALIFAPKEVQLSEADKADPLAFFERAIAASNPSLRALPVSGILQNDFNNTEANMGTLAGYGYSEKLADAMMGDVFQFKMSICRAKALQQLDGYSGRLFILTDNNMIIGSTLNGGKMAGLPLVSCSVTSDSFHQNAQAVVPVKITVSYGSDIQLFKSLAVVGYSFDAEELSGIASVTLKKVSERTYQVVTKCNDVNLYDKYAAQLATAALWKVTNLNTGAAIAVTTVTSVPAQKGFTLTLSSAPAAPYRIGVTIADLSTLAGAGIEGLEQSEVYVDSANI
jgi:hypothetical protein